MPCVAEEVCIGTQKPDAGCCRGPGRRLDGRISPWDANRGGSKGGRAGVELGGGTRMGWSLSGGCSRRTCLPVGPREMLASVLGSEQAPARCALHSALAKKVLLVLNVLWSLSLSLSRARVCVHVPVIMGIQVCTTQCRGQRTAQVFM